MVTVGPLRMVGPVQVRVIQLLPAAAVCGVQDATGTLVVTFGAGQVVVVQLLPEVAAEAVQLPTGVLRLLFVEHVRVTQLLPAAAV